MMVIINKILAIGILIQLVVLIAPNVYARNLSDSQRYNDGYSNGAQAAATDSTYNPTCDPTGAYTSGGGHSQFYCNGWANGYAATWNTKHVAQGGGNATIVQGGGGNATSVGAATANWKDFGDFSDLSNIPLVGGMIASHSITTGVLHNEQGVFIPWNVICQKGSQYLLESCATLVNPDGSLTAKGDTAVGCVRNGFAAAILATKLGMTFDQINSGLGFAAGATGCGGIVDLNQIQNSPDFQSLLAAVPGQ